MGRRPVCSLRHQILQGSTPVGTIGSFAMRRPYVDESRTWPAECMPGVVSQYEIQPVQRFSIREMQNNAGRALYLPFERRAHLSHHPTSSRLHTAEGRAVIAATHGTTGSSFGPNPSTASLCYLQPTTRSSLPDQGLYPSQQAYHGKPPAYSVSASDHSLSISTPCCLSFRQLCK